MSILEFILLIVFIMWLGGWGFHIAGDAIHILLVVLILGIIYRVFTGRRIG